MGETVDILLATYNTKIEYLKKQIDSILNQTYKNIHLIISDDFSENEEVRKTLKDYEAQDDRITVFFQEKNIGYIKNFEFLLKQSNANFIMFSDHDDIWYKEKVEECLNLLIKENVDMIYCNSTQIDENDNIIKQDYFKYKNIPLINRHGKQAKTRYIGNGCAQMFTKLIKEQILPFKESVMAHDWLVSFIANENKGILYINKPLFGYRLHNANVFGGRSLEQNLSNWKDEYGNSYKSYLKYRNEYVINKAYLNGAKMCLEYTKNEDTKKFLQELIKYYENLKKSKYVNFHIFKFFKFLAGRNLVKKLVKEFLIFHLPILGYLKFQ